MCGFENPPGMRFCGGCGAPIAEVDVEEERKHVAVLFADICDFTALVASSDAEETKDKIDLCLNTMAEEVVAMDGVVEKFIGDAIMAVFGVPVAHENDAERAVRAALRILEQVRWFGATAGLEVELRIGVHFGEVIASVHDQAPGRGHHIFGDVVNVASRLEKTGEAGAVVVSEEVYRQTDKVFEFESLPAVSAKGVAEPLVRYRVLGEKAERGKIRGIRGLSAPMVGRADELARLMKSYGEAADGKGARVTAVVGEAGIGKTRLSEELIQAARDRGPEPRVLYGRCLSYTGAPSYLPFIQMLKSEIGAKDSMTPAEVKALLEIALTDVLGGTTLGDVNAAGILGELLAPAGNGYRPGGHDTEQIQAQTFWLFEKYLAALAERGPVILLIEDAQWGDASTLALIEHLARALSNSRTLVLLNTRPAREYGPGAEHLMRKLGELPYFDSITLEDLSADEAGELVAALLEVERLPAPTRTFIIERAAGNPFFVEEIIKALIEAGVLVQRGDSWAATRDIETLDIPDTIEGVLRSRVDNLPRVQKRLIQRASVVGEVFWRKVVAELMERAVDDFLDDLERRDMVRQRLESIFEDDLEYMFKHAILHETVYNGILRRVRRNLHLRTAEWIERNYREHIESYLSLVGHHFEMGGEAARAADYYLRAGLRASSLYANDSAKEFFGRATENGKTPDVLRPAYLNWGEVCARTGDNDNAISNYEACLTSCRSAVEEAEVYQRLGDVHERMSDYPKALDYYTLAEELLDGQPPTLILSHIYKSTAWVHYLRGDNDRAFETAQKADEVLGLLGREDYEADMVRARLHSVRGAVYHEWNLPDEARAEYDHTLELYEKNGNLFGVGTILNNIGTTEMTQGHIGAAITTLQQSFDLAGRSGNRFGQAVACCNIGECYLTIGDYDEAKKYFDLYLEINAGIGNLLGDGYAYDGLAYVAAEAGDPKKAEELFEKSIAIFEEVGATGNEREVRLSLAEFLAGRGRREEAEAIVAAERARQDDTRLQLREAIIMSRLPADKWRDDEEDRVKIKQITYRGAATLAALKDVIERFEAAVALGRLSAALGDEDNARIFRAEAEKLARGLEAGIEEESQRESFRRRLDEQVWW
jgi:predicted ATPase/class 3 adenylate cyclase